MNASTKINVGSIQKLRVNADEWLRYLQDDEDYLLLRFNDLTKRWGSNIVHIYPIVF